MDEIEKVKVSYARGELEPLRQQLENFILTHRAQILQFKNEEEKNWAQELDLATAMKLFILKVRTIDIEAEMRDQIRAIKMELGENVDENEIHNSKCIDWIRKHGPSWRGYRVLAIIYVFDQNKDLMLSRLAM
ncbi:MAG: hypothetical protein GX640_22735 [Fibrobacter sp.]|nr:hypothetical protein [Fibrobacter sp.]